ncbi:hypothetical protein K435DRAFT_803751 [Dendrothele bispora CBS 962.96]|uniref:Uncharacterized protein n=1 Tax=Dendrothele bispora (strain CBS 962.96) TaxID=1314807 RepID=A0A4S8LGU3_DENBC|nr:hypothetical protein K435DRAFT_803751 [Dendrothele bispora CBS 962.96]
MSSLSVHCTVRVLWTFDNGPSPTTNSSWLILECTPSPGHSEEFMACLAALENAAHSPSVKTSWSIDDTESDSPYILVVFCPTLTPVVACENVRIPPKPEHLPVEQTVAFYDHWNTERKALTPQCLAVLRFHRMVECASNGVLHNFLIAESVTVLESTIPWFAVYDVVDVANLAVVTDCAHLSRSRVLPVIRAVLSMFVPSPLELLQKMETWGCVVTGSSAIWVGLLQSQEFAIQRYPWRPRTLDLLMEDSHAHAACLFFGNLGYTRKWVYVVDSPWKQSSSFVTELHRGEGPALLRGGHYQTTKALGVTSVPPILAQNVLAWFLLHNDAYINGVLFDTDTLISSVVSIPIHCKDESGVSLDDLALDVFLDGVPRGIYSPARYRFCVDTDVAQDCQITFIAVNNDCGNRSRVLAVKHTTQPPGKMLNCTETDKELYRSSVAASPAIDDYGARDSVVLNRRNSAVPSSFTFPWSSLEPTLGISCHTDDSVVKNTFVTLTSLATTSPVHFASEAAESALVAFVSGCGVHCGYPGFTFNKVTFPLREVELGFRIGWNALKGFRYDEDFLQSRMHCIGGERSWSDKYAFSWCWAEKDGHMWKDETWTLSLTCRFWSGVQVMSWFYIVQQVRKGSGAVDSVGIWFLMSMEGKTNSMIRVVYVDGPHVLNVLAKAPETALSSFLCSWALVSAYPLMTLNRQTFSVIWTRDGEMIGGECLDEFVSVALMDDMPEAYCGPRSWKDRLTLLFQWADLVSDLGNMGGNSVWSLGE